MKPVLTIDQKTARRLALVQGGLLKPELTGLPKRAKPDPVKASHAIIERFGYLQLDTVSIAGARSHSIVLLSRLPDLQAEFGEQLLEPSSPLFEYWGHEACWMPLALYPCFEFRRKRLKEHRIWKKVFSTYKKEHRALKKRLRDEGPLKSADFDGESKGGWWNHKVTKRVAIAMWSSGELAIRERKNFQRTYDLADRVIPEAIRKTKEPLSLSMKRLLDQALLGHGWAERRTLAQTWRLSNLKEPITKALNQLEREGTAIPCHVKLDNGKIKKGWIHKDCVDLVGKLAKPRSLSTASVLLSPFDPVLWDRQRTLDLFDFHQVLEIFKPAPERVYGYYCLPILSGEKLIGRVDLKADRKVGRLRVLSTHYESSGREKPRTAREKQALDKALSRFSKGVGLKV